MSVVVPQGAYQPGDLLCVDIVMESGFINMQGLQFGLNWDHTVLEYVDIVSPTLKNKFTIHNGIELSNNATEDSFLEELGLIIGDTHTDEGELIIAGYNLSPEGWYLDSASTMAFLRFKVVGQLGESSDITISNHLTGTHFIDEERSQVGYAFEKGVVSIPFALDDQSGITIYPNPVKNIATIEIDSPIDGAIDIQVYNGIGQAVFQKNEEGVSGINRFSIDGTSFPAGVYYCHIKVNESTYVRKLIFIK